MLIVLDKTSLLLYNRTKVGIVANLRPADVHAGVGLQDGLGGEGDSCVV